LCVVFLGRVVGDVVGRRISARPRFRSAEADL